MNYLKRSKALLIFLAFAMLSPAHVGNSDIYLDGHAGPYRLFVTVRPPNVVPGVAEVEVRSETPGVEDIRAVPLSLIGAGAKFAPVPDKLKVSPQDPQFFTGSLWMMVSGSWQVRLTVHGSQGDGILAIPVPTAALATKGMQTGLGVILAMLLVFLFGGMVAIIGAGVREARLRSGMTPDASHVYRGRVAMAVAFVVLLGALWFGRQWWNSAAAEYGQIVYKPLQMTASLNPDNELTLKMTDPGWFKPTKGRLQNALFVRTIDDLVLDHEHLMHLYAIREPGLDVVYHLHPDLAEAGVFRLQLPTMPAGNYKLYADVVHETGFPETMVSSLQISAVSGRPLTGDDATGSAAPWQTAPLSTQFKLPDGYRMEWLRDPGPLRAKAPAIFRFRLLDPQGLPAHMQLYMGMIGHAAFVKTDGSAFAHIHPSGSVNMAALMLAQKNNGEGSNRMDMNMSMPEEQGLPNEAGFPYGFPSPGRYRIFVQMKHDDTVETGVFDADVQ